MVARSSSTDARSALTSRSVEWRCSRSSVVTWSLTVSISRS
ncbi:hypothetical protein ACFPRL_07990 [Pseudoclavibacter helvolus]